ncbi:MAG: ABC transporter substrate-binding protein [Burkholderiales bacterium]|nr:ABC transporter substrate-binding protein [Burkholderiales bacterium]
MQSLIGKFMLVLALTHAAQALPAQELAPDVLLQSTTLEVVATMQRVRDMQGGQMEEIARLVETKIAPLFDFAHMTRIAVARNWRLATPDQQVALTAAFKTLLVRTYSTALLTYRDQVIEFRTMHSAPGATEVTVKSMVRKPGTAPVAMNYDMEKTPAGWKVFDITVEGISLVTNYRDSFAQIVRDRGMDGLIKTLEKKNVPGASGAPSA